MRLDLNADLGEGAGFDAELMGLVTSANVCCGAHAGGPDETAATLALARRHGVAVGAHPGYPDREHFGRRNWPETSVKLYTQLVHQLSGFMAAADRVGVTVKYIKPHGALYNQAAAIPRSPTCSVPPRGTGRYRWSASRGPRWRRCARRS